MKSDVFLNSALAFAVALSSHWMALRLQEGWQRVQPVGESFTVFMPGVAREGTRVVPLSVKDSVPARVYYSLA